MAHLSPARHVTRLPRQPFPLATDAQAVALGRVSNWIAFYNIERPHSSLERKTPKAAYWAGRQEKLAA